MESDVAKPGAPCRAFSSLESLNGHVIRVQRSNVIIHYGRDISICHFNHRCRSSPHICILFHFCGLSTVDNWKMTDPRTSLLAAFQVAKADFEKKARNATATEGVIDNGEMLETELVSLFLI